MDIQSILDTLENGDLVEFASGAYNNLALTINKSITLIGYNAQIIGDGTNIAFNIVSNNVNIGGFLIERYDFGIYNTGHNVKIENNTINNITNCGIITYNGGPDVNGVANIDNNSIKNNTINNTNVGIFSDSVMSNISDNKINNSRDSGILNNGYNNSIENNDIQNSEQYGAYNSGYGNKIKNNNIKNANMGGVLTSRDSEYGSGQNNIEKKQYN